jgi:hypothetical protein
LANLGNDETVNNQLLQQYYQIGKQIKKYNSDVMIFCQRRKHKGFLFVKQYIEEVIAQY